MKDSSELLNKLTMEISRNKETEAVNDINKKLDILMSSMETSAAIIENSVDAINHLNKKYRKLKKRTDKLEERIDNLDKSFAVLSIEKEGANPFYIPINGGTIPV